MPPKPPLKSALTLGILLFIRLGPPCVIVYKASKRFMYSAY